MAYFMRINFENPKIKQSEIANQLIYSTSTLQRYGNEIYMLSPYRINLDTTKKRIEKLQILLLPMIYIPILTLKDLT